jgi:DNA-binding protein
MSEEQKALDEVIGGSQKEQGPEEAQEEVPDKKADEEVPAVEAEEAVPVQEDAGKEAKKEEKQEPARKESRKQRKGIEENVVLVGKKPTMSYVLAAVTQFSDGMEQIHLKARGKSISRAVDVAEVVRKRFVQNLKTEINIDTQEITDENKNRINVSTIDIVLKK